ncbi:hypothetical protein C8Q76DRAFT_692488 [Earliella scabrosa]|nr:hypothetical protein C8Q76DRAFT_692488 [Earliella scabrosa]
MPLRNETTLQSTSSTPLWHFSQDRADIQPQLENLPTRSWLFTEECSDHIVVRPRPSLVVVLAHNSSLSSGPTAGMPLSTSSSWAEFLGRPNRLASAHIHTPPSGGAHSHSSVIDMENVFEASTWPQQETRIAGQNRWVDATMAALRSHFMNPSYYPLCEVPTTFCGHSAVFITVPATNTTGETSFWLMPAAGYSEPATSPGIQDRHHNGPSVPTYAPSVSRPYSDDQEVAISAPHDGSTSNPSSSVWSASAYPFHSSQPRSEVPGAASYAVNLPSMPSAIFSADAVRNDTSPARSAVTYSTPEVSRAGSYSPHAVDLPSMPSAIFTADAVRNDTSPARSAVTYSTAEVSRAGSYSPRWSHNVSAGLLGSPFSAAPPVSVGSPLSSKGPSPSHLDRELQFLYSDSEEAYDIVQTVNPHVVVDMHELVIVLTPLPRHPENWQRSMRETIRHSLGMIAHPGVQR